MSIEKMHEQVYQRLMESRQEDENFYFMPRRQKSDRLKKGYWFLGSEDYLAISFWSGSDDANKTPNISFMIVPPKSKLINLRGGCRSFIQLTARDSKIKEKYLEKMSKEMTGFSPFCAGEWNKKYSSINYMKNLDEFLENDKPKIDDYLRGHKIDGLSLLDAGSLKYVNNIESIKNSQV